MRVLLTGASGLIGRHVLDQLLRSGAQVTALSSAPREPEPGVHWVKADFLCDDLAPIIAQAKAEHVIHLAWESGRYDHPVHLAWLGASLRWLEPLRDAGCKHLLTAGSSMEYRWDGSPCHETQTPLEPSTIYGEAKLALGRLCAAFCRGAGIEHVHPRVFFVCGPTQREDKLIPGAVRAVLEGKPFTCKSGGAWRDYLEAADVASTLARLSESRAQGAVNVASGKAVSLGQMIQSIGQVLGRPELLTVTDPTGGGPKDIVEADVTRLSRLLGDAPRFDPAAAIGRIIQHLQHKHTVETH